ncbi:MAG: ribonucleoside-diphosphate reductase subunit alpha [Crocinitomicaceae bacterium]|nr:ribonucleoside-diphosphate reductase subunit alpha [Crocinitomicaceae bacterium]
MYVIKRDGKKEAIKFDKITARIMKMCYGLDPIVSPESVAMKVIEGIYDGISTMDLDNLAADVASSRSIEHPDYALLASRIAVSNLHKETKKSFSEVIEDLYNNKATKTGENTPLIAEDVYTIIQDNKELLDSTIIYDRDFKFDYLGFRILADAYLMRLDGHIVERPQQLLMRVAVGIHKRDIQSVIKTYNYMSEGWFLHDITTLNHAGRPTPQLSSSFSIAIKENSIATVYDSLKSAAQISQANGELGIAVHAVTASKASNGLIPMLQVFNETAKYTANHNEKKRNSFSVYIEPWHESIFEFLDIKKSYVNEELSTRNINNALWIPDLFMERVKSNGDWTLMSPIECVDLSNTHGKAFEKLYKQYETEGKGVKTIKAQDLWFKILESQIETGLPYIMYKDAVNTKSNQLNIGVVKASNNSANLTLAVDKEDVAVCNIGSVALPKFVVNKDEFNHEKLFEVVYQLTYNLDKIYDVNTYPLDAALNYGTNYRPLGIGVVGLADTFALMGIAFDSDKAKQLNKEIFETIYYSSLTASKDLATEDGEYFKFKGSPLSKGLFQFDFWKAEPSSRWDWQALKEGIKEHGVRNSLLVSIISTESIAQILGYNENIEPFASNLSIKRKSNGEYIVINKYLLKDLITEGLWDKEMRQKILMNSGSIQSIDRIPQKIRNTYKTIWEISQKSVLDLAVDRGAFICQSQAMNIFMENADFGKLTSMHFYGWEKGLKTGLYKLNKKTSSDSIQLSLNRENLIISNKELDSEKESTTNLSFDDFNAF